MGGDGQKGTSGRLHKHGAGGTQEAAAGVMLRPAHRDAGKASQSPGEGEQTRTTSACVRTHNKPTRLPRLPGPQLVFAAPGELPEALVVLVVVVEHSVQAGGAQVQQGVVGCLLLLATGVAVEEVVDLVGNFWAGGQGLVSGVQEMSTKNKAHQDNAWLWWNHEAHLPRPLLEPRFVPRGMINVVSRQWRNNREDGITQTQLD